MTDPSDLSTFESDVETIQGSSEASVDIITERETIAYETVRSASPRKPLPAQWLPRSSSPSLATAQRAKAHDDTKASPGGSPVDRKPVRATRSSLDIGKAHADRASFLTKEALDAVNANITSPTLRRSPSKMQRSPTKMPWTSSTVSPKVGSLRQSAGSPTKSSPPRVTHIGTHGIADRKRAPSSLVSNGASSFHTARGSPVRSPAISQSSFPSAEDAHVDLHYDYPGTVADANVKHINDISSRPKASTIRVATSLRTRASRPELSISIPPPDTAIDAEPRSASTLASATSSSGTSVGRGSIAELDHAEGLHLSASATQSSRIPRMPNSRGSSARAPTLSSTLKQAKSTQTLQSPKTTKGKAELARVTSSKTTGARSTRHVRTVDSAGSTPILSHRTSRESSIPASVASVATTGTERTTHASDVNLLSSYLQDTATGALESAESLPASSTTSRTTSTSTLKAPQATSRPVPTESASAYGCKNPDHSGGLTFTGPHVLVQKLTLINLGNIHSSDADDKYDDSTMFASGLGDGPQITSPIRGRSSQYNPGVRRATASEASMQSSSASDLRATATEFVPAQKDTLDCESM